MHVLHGDAHPLMRRTAHEKRGGEKKGGGGEEGALPGAEVVSAPHE